MKIPSDQLNRWKAKAAEFLASYSYTCADILTGREAWAVAHKSGIYDEVHGSRDILDAHVQTALEKIFPNAVFQDKKVY